MFSKSILTVVAVSLFGCATSMTLPVVGQFRSGDEQFRGEATGYLDGTGVLSIRTERGASCTGSFKRSASGVTGEGNFTCSDGRTGDFYYTSKGNDGEGFGKASSGDLFRFRFGGPEYTAQQQREWEALSEGLKSLGRSLNPASTRTTCFTWGGMVDCTTR